MSDDVNACRWTRGQSHSYDFQTEDDIKSVLGQAEQARARTQEARGVAAECRRQAAAMRERSASVLRE